MAGSPGLQLGAMLGMQLEALRCRARCHADRTALPRWKSGMCGLASGVVDGSLSINGASRSGYRTAPGDVLLNWVVVEYCQGAHLICLACSLPWRRYMAGYVEGNDMGTWTGDWDAKGGCVDLTTNGDVLNGVGRRDSSMIILA